MKSVLSDVNAVLRQKNKVSLTIALVKLKSFFLKKDIVYELYIISYKYEKHIKVQIFDTNHISRPKGNRILLYQKFLSTDSPKRVSFNVYSRSKLGYIAWWWKTSGTAWRHLYSKIDSTCKYSIEFFLIPLTFSFWDLFDLFGAFFGQLEKDLKVHNRKIQNDWNELKAIDSVQKFGTEVYFLLFSA